MIKIYYWTFDRSLLKELMGDLQRVNSITAEGRLKVCKINDRCILFPFTGGMIMFLCQEKMHAELALYRKALQMIDLRIIVVIGTW